MAAALGAFTIDLASSLAILHSSSPALIGHFSATRKRLDIEEDYNGAQDDIMGTVHVGYVGDGASGGEV